MSSPTSASVFLTLILFFLLTVLTLTNFTINRLYRIFTRPTPNRQPTSNPKLNRRGHLLILLGSGGHTSEMLSILRTLGPEYLDIRFHRRTWVVSSGDGFSAARAGEFEKELELQRGQTGRGVESTSGNGDVDVKWDIVTVRRARKVHQSLLTTPMSALECLVDCLGVLRGRHGHALKEQEKGNQRQRGQRAGSEDGYNYNYPDLILTNGPGTGVIMVLASLILLFFGLAPIRVKNSIHKNKNEAGNKQMHTQAEVKTEIDTKAEVGSMRSIYIESWARVKTMSLSGRILRFLASRVLVQWRGLGEVDRTVVLRADGEGDDGVVSVGRENGGVSGKDTITRTSMRIQRREDSRDGTDGGSIWPRRTEYIGAVVT